MNSPMTPEMRAWVEQTLRSLSPREKIGQTSQERLATAGLHEGNLEQWLQENPVGSVFCGGEIIEGTGDSAESTRGNIRRLQQISKVPLLVAGDLESGAGAAVRGLTCLPSALALGAANDPGLAYEYGKWTAIEGRAAGFTWTFSPVVDLIRNWLNPVVSTRALGSSPDHVARIAAALIRGMQDHGIAACAKHFPGDGVDFRDQHLVTSINSLPKEEWWASYGAVFREVIRAGVRTFMTGHIALPWLDPMKGPRPRPATVSSPILRDLLRGELGFDGVIVSDALQMAGLTGWARYEERIVEAFNAGNDVMLWPEPRYFEVMERALDDGRITEERLDESVRRILALKARMHLDRLASDGTDPEASPLENGSLPIDLTAQAREVGRRVSEKSVTLVRDRDGLLPLDPAKTKRVLLHLALSPHPERKDDLSQLVGDFKERGVDLTLLENGNCLDVLNLEARGLRWDAYVVVFSLQTHQMKNTMRPVGDMAEVMWTLQNAETAAPIVPSDLSLLAFGMPPAREAESAGGMPKVPKGQGLGRLAR